MYVHIFMIFIYMGHFEDMSTKANLKNVKEAIGAGRYEDALKFSQKILEFEPENYNALVFLALAQKNLHSLKNAEETYKKAIELDPSQYVALQGLSKIYEENSQWNDYVDLLERLLHIHIASGNAKRTFDTAHKLIEIYRNEIMSKPKLIESLERLLPESSCYSLLVEAGENSSEVSILLDIASLQEKEIAERIHQEIETRRRRLNAGTLASITAQVQKEVYSSSKIDYTYERILKSAQSDADINLNQIKTKYLKYLQMKLGNIQDKDQVREKLLALAKQLVDEEADTPVPYEILVEYTNAQSPDDYNQQILNTYKSRFPDTGLSKLIQGYILYKTDSNIEEALELFSDGLEAVPTNMFGYHTLCWLYHDSKEFELGLEYATKGRDLVVRNGLETGLNLDRLLSSIELCMADCYRGLDPKYYDDALKLYDKIISIFPNNTQALLGMGLVFSAEKKYQEATKKFQTVLQLDPANALAKAEIGWIQCEQGQYDIAIQSLLEAIDLIPENANFHYRLGKIYWTMGGDYRTDKAYAFKELLQAAKLDPQCSPAFTLLGHYYKSIELDRSRAKRCFQKAFSLNSSDEDAGIQLSDYYLEDDEIILAEAVFRAVTQNNSKAGWAWKRLGFIELSNENHLDAITAFQKALRSDSRDINCWEGLAEAYRLEGRYMAALKAFARAMELNPQSIQTGFQVATIKSKLGLFEEAITQYRETLAAAGETDSNFIFLILEGLGDTLLTQAKELFSTGFYGRAADALSDSLEIVLQALTKNGRVQLFWKLLGDLCITYRKIPSHLDLCPLRVLQKLANIIQEHNVDSKLHFKPDATTDLISQLSTLDLTAEDVSLPAGVIMNILLSIANYSFKYSLWLCGNNQNLAPAYWHDIALAYYFMYQHNSDTDPIAVNYLNTAVRCIKVALKLEPLNYLLWNALGVMTITINPRVSQHMFIKASELSSKSAIPWTNLGYLYFSHSDLDLANQAFSAAQSLDPDWVPAWVGQAMIATILQSRESSDLFEHAFDTSHGSLVEANYGYAMSQFLAYSNNPSASNAMLLAPSFALLKHTEQRPEDIAVLNLSGLVFERLEQYSQAAEVFARAILVLERRLSDETETTTLQHQIAMVRANLGRVLCASGDFSGAINSYITSLQLIANEPANVFKTYCHLGAGLAYFFNGELENSLQMFELSLAETSEEGSNSLTDVRKDVIVLLSQVLWALGGEEHRDLARQELLGCIAQHSGHLPAIFCLCAMGMLRDDMELTTAALRELMQLRPDEIEDADADHEIDQLFHDYFELKGSASEASRVLLKSVHRTPSNPILWSRLSRYLSSHQADSLSAITVATTTVSLLLSPTSSDAPAEIKSKAYQDLSIALMNRSRQNGQAKYKFNFRNQALIAAQQAVLMAPWNKNSRTTLKIAHSLQLESTDV